MAERRDETSTDPNMAEEAEHLTGGPGVVVTKSQARGGLAGIVLGGIAGAAAGAILGVLLFEGRTAVIIAVVAFAVAGATFGGVAGGFLGPKRNVDESGADR